MNAKYKYIYLSEAKEYGNLDLSILREATNPALDSALKNLLAANMEVLDASGIPQGSKLDNLNIISVTPNMEVQPSEAQGFTVSIPMGAGQARQVKYRIDRDLKGRNVLTLDYSGDPQMNSLIPQIITMLNASNPDNAARLSTARITNIIPHTARTLEYIQAFTVIYPQDSGIVEEEQYRADRSSGQLMFLSTGTLANTIKNMLLQTISNSDPQKKAMLNSGEVLGIEPNTAVRVPEVTGFKLSYVYNGDIYEPEYKVSKTPDNKIIFSLVTGNTLEDTVLNMLLQTIPDNDPRKKAMLDSGEVFGIEPNTAVRVPEVTGFKLSYTYNGDTYESEYKVSKTPDNKIAFSPVTGNTLEDTVMDMLLGQLEKSGAEEGDAVAATGKISDISPAEANTLDKVKTFRLTYTDQAGAVHVEDFQVVTDSSGKLMFQRIESLENKILQYIRQQFANDAPMTTWLNNVKIEDITPVEGTQGESLQEIESFTATDGQRSETFVQTQQNGRLYFAINSVEDDIYKYLASVKGMESFNPSNSKITITDPAGDPTVKFVDVNSFVLTRNDGGPKVEFKASNPPGKPKAFTYEVVSSDNLSEDLKKLVSAMDLAKGYQKGFVVSDIRPVNAKTVDNVIGFRVSDPEGKSIQYLGMRGGKPVTLRIEDMVKLYATSEDSGLQYYKNPDTVLNNSTQIKDILQDKAAGGVLDGIKSFTLVLPNGDSASITGVKNQSGVIKFALSNTKEGDSTAPGQGLTITDRDKKKIDQIVGKVLRKIKDLEFTGWTNFRER